MIGFWHDAMGLPGCYYAMAQIMNGCKGVALLLPMICDWLMTCCYVVARIL